MHPILLKLGPITIYTYGFFVALGVLVTYILTLKEAEDQNLDANNFSNLFFWLLISAIIGARVVYILGEWKYFIQQPMDFIFSNSGFVFYGGVIFALIIFYPLTSLYNLPKIKTLDILALYLPLGHAFGRLGCFSYGCCYGKITQSFIGLKFPEQSPAGIVNAKVIPTQLISAFSLVIIFLLLRRLRDRKYYPGKITSFYLIFYGVFRFIIEFFRGDYRPFWGIFYISQWISLFAVILGFGILFYNKKIKHE